MSENYIMLNGKRVDLTDEQIEKLGLKVEKKDYFSNDNSNDNYDYYFIDDCGVVCRTTEHNGVNDIARHEVANYCTDDSLMQQRAFHETLSRLLWRFSMQNDGDKINWLVDETAKYYIYFQSTNNKFYVDYSCCLKQLDVYFKSNEVAQRAIDEIILPFIKEHPDFVW